MALSRVLLLLILAPSVLPSPASAIVVRFDGVVDSVFDPLAIGNDLTPGMAFSAILEFDDSLSAPPTPGSDGYFFSHNAFAIPPARLESDIGPWRIDGGANPFGPPEVRVTLGKGPDGDLVGVTTSAQQIEGSDLDLVTGFGSVTVDILLEGPDGALPSLLLQDVPWDAAAWTSASVLLTYYVDGSEGYYAPSGATIMITGISIVPEPASGALLGFGLAALARRRLGSGRAAR